MSLIIEKNLYTIEKVNNKNILIEDMKQKDGGYIDLLTDSTYLTEDGKYYYIKDISNRDNLGYVIFDKYNKEPDSVIVYFKVLKSIGVESKNNLLKEIIEISKGHDKSHLYIRVSEDDKNLLKAVESLKFIKRGMFITNRVGNSFSAYFIFSLEIGD